MLAHLLGPTDVAGFRSEAQALLARQVPPDQVQWSASAQQDTVSAPSPPMESHARGLPRAASAIVPASFVRLCDHVVQHRDPERFALLYRLLWRLVHEPHLRHEPADADMTRAHHMAHAVRRETHKLKTNLRWRSLEDPAHPGRPLHLAWSEPAHHIVEAVSPWLAQRYDNIRWALLTPERSVYWDGDRMFYGPGAPHPPAMNASDGDWLACWRQIFGSTDKPH